MELYYKDLISEEASLEKLVDELLLVVQGAEELVDPADAGVNQVRRKQTVDRLQRLKEGCLRLKDRARAGAAATHKMVRQHPYYSVGLALAAGVLAGLTLRRTR